MESNKTKRKNRTLIYFIEAAKDIIKEEGMEALTIRKVADRAGYNSATIYNYFTDLDQLLLYASLGSLAEYNEEVTAAIPEGASASDSLTIMWEIFLDHAFANPKIYNRIFFGKNSHNLHKLCEQYFDLFPNEKTSPIGEFEEIADYVSLSHRNAKGIEQICEEEGLPTDRVDEINNIMILTFRGLLSGYILNGSTDAEGYKERMLQYYKFLMTALH